MSPRVPRLLLLTVLALTACRERGLTALAADLSVPTEIDFGVVYVGHARTQALEISNRGRAPVTFHVLVSAPFTAPAQLDVPGGMSVRLDVELTAESEGPVSGTLQLEADGPAFDVALTALGTLPPRCVPTNDCVESDFDPASGCVEHAVFDGTSCGANDRCISGGQCQHGACVGEAIRCDDGNPCTLR